ncbi:MAG: hypothetical protein JWN50_273 [Parcubacteria group bacterium]|nr:hypothetical protein [Parcubacteria group bacterium]
MLNSFFSALSTGFSGQVFHALFGAAPVWVPILLVTVWWDFWLHYKQRAWVKEQGSVLLEVRIPRDMLKSPFAMELFLNTLYNPVTGNLIAVYWKGAMRVWFSLELVSIDGIVHFYIWTTKGYKSRIETQLYAQFPNIEVHEVPDYALAVHYNPAERTFGWFGQFTLTKADPHPIKTYIDYGLDRDPKEEYKHDPLVSTLEFLGSLKKGEQAWIQIMIQAHAKEGLSLGRIVPKPDWKDAIKKEIQDIVDKGKIKSEDDKKPSTMVSLSKGQQDTIAAIERTTAKVAFDTMIRATYFASKEAYNPTNIGGIIGSVMQFNAPGSNGFRPDFGSAYAYPWQDFGGRMRADNERKLLEAYKRRSFFHPPFKNFHGKPFILTTEELATLWHFPSGLVAATPTLTRIPSKKAEAPSNLPI